MLQSVAIYSKDNTPKTRDGVQRLVNELCRRRIRIHLHQRMGEESSHCEGDLIDRFTGLEELLHPPDMVFSVGGDGTFLETVMKVKDSGIPVAGVNTGRMGFLANIPGEDIGASIESLCKNEYEIIERSMLNITRPAAIFGENQSTALNEITVQKASLSMLTINVYVGDAFLNTYWADGLIVSTATGSTAYNLSAGGPILSPEDESIIISPISAHNLTIRPIVLAGGSKLKMVMEGRTTEFMATCDFRFKSIPINQEVHIEQTVSKLKTVMLRGRDFYNTLRSKLMWGVDRRN